MDDCDGPENRCAERCRGFESSRFRSGKNKENTMEGDVIFKLRVVCPNCGGHRFLDKGRNVVECLNEKCGGTYDITKVTKVNLFDLLAGEP